MSDLIQYEKVRVRALLRDSSEYDGWRLNKRPPRVGEVGTLIDILHADGLPDHYVVEKSDATGAAIWLSEFLREELEQVALEPAD